MRWEYEIIAFPESVQTAKVKDALNDLGAAGWEVVESHVNAWGQRFVLKREIEREGR